MKTKQTRHKRYFILIVVFMMFFSSCGNSTNTMNSEEQTVTEITENNSETTIKATEIHTDNNKLETQQEPKSLTWQKAYVDYLESFWGDREPYTQFSYSLIYLDNDDIPELFICTGAEAGGEIVATYFDGQVQTEQISRMGARYIERSGLLYCDNGHMGYYPVYIKKLENGKISNIGTGEYFFIMDDEYRYILDEDGIPIEEYRWEDEIVSEEVYYEQINALFNIEQGVHPQRMYSMEELFSVLETGVHTSAGHRYELIQKDITWAEAQALCKEKGGYLATITSPDEQDIVATQIAKEEKQNISFYVGYRYNEWIGEEFFASRWINADGSFIVASPLDNFWEYSAPDYDYRNKEWENDQNDCGLVKYYDSTKQIYLFNAPEELLASSPKYSGKMGFICEFDN